MVKKHSSKDRWKALRHFFRRRNLIVVSDASVDHYPISGKFLLAGLTALIGGFSWVSYSTGIYMASQAALEQKDQQIETTTLQKKQIGQEYSLLKRDLLKLRDNTGEMGEYVQFVLDQHEKERNDFSSVFAASAATDSGTSERLFERINFLEGQVQELQQENEQIVLTVRERTKDKIKELRNVIKMTGLSPRIMEKAAEKKFVNDTAQSDDKNGKGGPYIPDELSELGTDFFADLDRMMLLDTIVAKLPLSSPMADTKTTSKFGRRVDPFTRRWAMHSGLDFVGERNAPIHAPADGTVKIASRQGAYGNLIEIEHGLGITTRYGHLSKVSVQPGQKVKTGQHIGNQGSTGRSTGQHLHYEVRLNKRPLNPMKFIKAGSDVQK